MSREQTVPARPQRLEALDYSVLQQCMHCGMCLPSCPTYAKTGRERHSPRGRIALMRAIADGELELKRTFADEMSFCLGCLACTTACPAGVDYATLFETARAHVEESTVVRTRARRLLRWFTLGLVFKRPRLLRALGRILWFYRASRLQALVRRTGALRLLPRRLRELESQCPTVRRRFSHELIAPWEAPTAKAAKSPGPSRRVALLTGCVQDLLFSEINRATADVLLANGCEVHTPPAQPCCGSLHAHNGDTPSARELARRQIDLIDPFAFDAIISNAGGCGSHLSRYDELLADDPAYAGRAAEWSRKVRDIHEWLAEIGFRAPASSGDLSGAVTYHESCHLCHGQKVSAQPRAVLDSIPGLERVELGEANWCCGSAGIYSLTQPATADWLLERKLGHVQRTGATIVATANPGCHLQLEKGLARTNADVRVQHPIVLLAEAYRRERERAAASRSGAPATPGR